MSFLTRRVSPTAGAALVAVAVMVALPAAAQTISVAVPSSAAGCQAGQVLQADGEACMPPPQPAPPTTVNILGPSPAEMSRLLAATPVLPSESVCAAGQVLQRNGQPCVRTTATPAAGRR